MFPAILFSSHSRADPERARRKWTAFVISSAVHCLVIATISFLDIQFEPQGDSARKYYVVMVPPKEEPQNRKVIWYEAPQPIPEIAPQQRIGTAERATGEIDPSHRTLIVQSEEHASKKQLIIEPDHPEPLPADVPTPNLLSVHAPEPLPKLPPKAFVAPRESPALAKSPDVAVLPDAPHIDAPKLQQDSNDLGALARLKISRPFVAPPAGARKPAGGGTGSVEIPPPPSLGITSSSSGIDAMIVGLNPAIGPPPQGSRSAQFARAPAEGLASSGVPANSAAVFPGVVSHGRPGAPAELSSSSAANPEKRTLKEIHLPDVNRTMSAPLRPSSRVIPAIVEAQFPDRNVYTLVIPRPDLAEYPADWIMWFSDREPDAAARASISAPVPNRKYSLVQPQAPPPVGGTVQFTAVIDRNGHIASSRVLKSRAAAAFQVEALAELRSWEFKPALRNGETVEVDVVLEIPFQLRVAPGSLP